MAMAEGPFGDVLSKAIGQAMSSSEMKGLAKAVIEEMTQNGLVTHAPMTISGVAPSSGGPLTAGVGAGGLIAGLTPATLVLKMVKNMGKPGPTPQLTGMASAICTHLMTGLVSLPTVTGVCGNSPTSPGPLVGEAMAGKITGLVGSGLAALMALPFGGISPQLQAMCDAFVTYIMGNAEVSYTTGQITGTCSAGGGAIIGGSGIGGKIQ